MKKIAHIEFLSVACGLFLLMCPDVNGQWSTTGNTLATDGVLGTNAGSNFGIRFLTNGTERMRLDNAGRILMGMSSIPGTPPTSALLYLKQASNGNDWVQFRRTADNGYWSFSNPNTGVPTWNLNWTPSTGTGAATMLSVNTSGNLGLGASPSFMNAKLNIKQTGGDWVHFQRTLDAGYWAIYNDMASQNSLSFYYAPQSGPALMNRLVLHNNGKVSIGTVSCPGSYGLYVANGILTEKVKVALISTADWADHVLSPDYPLMPLKEVSEFISCNGHLPGVPSAQEMVDQGIDVAKNDAMLMTKIEELTLYIIQLQTEVEQLKQNLFGVK